MSKEIITRGRQPPEVLAFGEPLAALYPLPGAGDTAGTGAYRMTWGGDTSNFSIGITKLGHVCTYITRVGADEFGNSFMKLWADCGVDTDQIQQDSGRTTGVYFVSFRDGKHYLTYYRGQSAATVVAREEIEWDYIRNARVLHVTGISQAISTRMLDLSFELMQFAKQNDMLISYDTNYRPLLWSVDRAKAVIFHTIREYADVVMTTDEEMQMLGLGEDPERLIDALPVMPRICAVKLGAKGSLLMGRQSSVWLPSYPVKVSDTVGAGDAYDAGLISAMLENCSLEEAGKLATAAAALTCRGTGPLERQPDRAELRAYLATTKPQREN